MESVGNDPGKRPAQALAPESRRLGHGIPAVPLGTRITVKGEVLVCTSSKWACPLGPPTAGHAKACDWLRRGTELSRVWG